MTEFWKAIKDFYSVELTDEYSKQATDRLIELREYAEMCPDNNTKNRYEQGQALRKEIYMYIVSYIKLVGYAPSVTEISERVDAGRATVWKHINNLVDDGLLKTNHPSTDRAYTPVGYGIRKISKETR